MLPLAPRIALRDASRNRAAAAPAICAVMAAVASSVALGAYLASDGARDARAYRPALPAGHVLVDPIESDPAAHADPGRRRGPGTVGHRRCRPAADAGLRAGEHRLLRGHARAPGRTGLPVAAPGRPSRVRRAGRPAPTPAVAIRETDYFGGYVQPGVDDGTALPLLTGADPATTAAATAVLRAGGVVVTDPRYLHDGLVTVRVNEVEAGPDRPDRATTSRGTRCPGRSARPACCCPGPPPSNSA